MKYKNVRFELISHIPNHLFDVDGKGRLIVKYGIDVEISEQDDGKTVKVFLTRESK